jgi:hypothetical protein
MFSDFDEIRDIGQKTANIVLRKCTASGNAKHFKDICSRATDKVTLTTAKLTKGIA